VSTSVGTGGNEKTLAIFLEFDRALSDPRLDGNNDTVFFQRAESFKLNVVQSAEAGVGTSVPPALRNDQLLLADVVIIFAQTQILNADIDTARREDTFVLTGSPNSIQVGRVQDAVQDMLDIINTGAAGVPYAGGPAWADATTNPSTTVEAQLDKIITDLATVGGTDKIEGTISGVGNAILTQTTLEAQLLELEDEEINGTKHGDIRLPMVMRAWLAQTSGTVWVFGEAAGANEYPHWLTTASSSILFMFMPVREGDDIINVRIEIESAATVDIDFEMFRYENNGTTRLRTSISGVTNAGGGGAVAIASITPTSQEIAGVGDKYAIEAKADSVVGTRRIIGAVVTVNRAAQ
jgi:hypothetical protein